MKEINLIHLFSNLIKDYEKVHGVIRFEVKKVDNLFVFTNVDQELLEILNISRNDMVGKTFADLPIDQKSKKMLPAIYEKAWNGEEMLYYEIFSTNKDIIVVYTINPVVTKDGKTDRLEGHCAILNAVDLGAYL